MADCKDCNGKCCKYIALELDEPTDRDDWDKIRWFLSHKNVIVYLDHDDDWIIEFQTPCKYLDKNNRCKNYENRPNICKEHDPEECEFSSGESPYQILLTCIEDLDEYLKNQE